MVRINLEFVRPFGCSNDVEFTFNSFLDPKFGGRSGAYRMVRAVDTIDPYTVRFTLKEHREKLGSADVTRDPRASYRARTDYRR